MWWDVVMTILSMATTKHLVVDISAHGLGHVAQAAAVLNAIAPDGDHVRVTVRSVAPVGTLRERIPHPFEVVPYRQDNGMIMHDALRVDEEKTMEWYREFHARYDERRSDAARELEALGPDLVLSDVPYLGLDAAALIGVPSVALCSLNWADVFRSYCGRYPDSYRIYNDIMTAYSNANIFLQPTPSMQMPDLERTRKISPIAFVGEPQLELMRGLSECEDGTKFVLIGVGGYGIDNFPLNSWPVLKGICWIFPDSLLAQCPRIQRKDLVAQSKFDGMKYIDLLATCSLVVTKTGYGTQTEAVVNQVPTICICRYDWPEHPFLAAWHEKHGEVTFIDWDDIGTSSFRDMVTDMLQINAWSQDPVVPDGAKQAADIIQTELCINQ